MKTWKTLLTLCTLLIWSSLISQEGKQEEIEKICTEVFAEWNLPGMAIVVVKDGKAIYLKGFGKTSYDSTGTSITPDTRFVIASTSKAMTAALLAITMEKNDIKWSDKVVKHLPDFQLFDPWVTQNIEIRDIMTHKTGFRAYATDDLPHFGYNRDEIYSILKHIEPTYSFRSTYAYNNAMFTVAAKIIEKYSGLSWDSAIKEYLFTPLAMKSTTTGAFVWKSGQGMAKGHRHYKEGELIKFEPRTDSDRGFAWLSAVAPAGFVVSTAGDMANWIIFNLSKGAFDEKEIISTTNHSQLFAPQTISGHDSTFLNNYAQGWTIEQSRWGRLIRHTGLAYGYTSLVALYPEKNLGMAILTNAGNTTNPHMAIAREVLDLYRGEDSGDWRGHYLAQFMRSSPQRDQEVKKDSIASLRRDLYTGVYYKDAFGKITIEQEGEQLLFSLKSLNKIPLKHKNQHTFVMSVPGVGNVEVEFFQGTNTPVESVTFKIGDPIGKFYKEGSVE